MFLPKTTRLLPDGRTTHHILLVDGHGSHATLELMWICRLNQVDILYLPAHSSHVLQPLDLGTFSPLKSRYCKDIADLAHLDDAAPVKKRRFVEAYQKAYAEIFTTRTLRAGWSAASLFPWNPNKTLNSLQLHKITTIQAASTTPPLSTFSSSLPPPSTPIRSPISNHKTLFKTPKHLHDIHQAVQRLGPLTRDQRTVFQKAQKALGEATAHHGILHATNKRLQQQLTKLESKEKKSKVILDPNTIFANVESIKRLLEEAEKVQIAGEAEKARIAEKKTRAKKKEPSSEEAALRTSRNLQREQMESCMFQ